MTFARVISRAQYGVRAEKISVETHMTGGLPRFTIVGLPETAVKESKDRVRSAILMSAFDFPSRRITVNLAPADLPKMGGRFDLAIAISILMASEQLPQTHLHDYELVGELGLSGELRATQGMLAMALAARNSKRAMLVPAQNAKEASLVNNVTIYPATCLLDVCAHFSGVKPLTPYQACLNTPAPIYPDLDEVKGQAQAKYALEVAASGQHNLLFVGPPGSGKTLLAKRLPGLLPKLSETQGYETAVISAISKKFTPKQWLQRPFRTPHHNASAVALVGGGNPPKPGEISLAHNGVLFLDELPEFQRHVLENLREPLEAGTITISRAAMQLEFPANFQLIAAMNPCPCGYATDPQKDCYCSDAQIQRYMAKLSGPFLDRIDCTVHVPRLPLTDFNHDTPCENSAMVAARVDNAHETQLQRQGKANAKLSTKETTKFCLLKPADQLYFTETLQALKLSARNYHRILKVARTVADLADLENIEREHLQVAIHLNRSIKT